MEKRPFTIVSKSQLLGMVTERMWGVGWNRVVEGLVVKARSQWERRKFSNKNITTANALF